MALFPEDPDDVIHTLEHGLITREEDESGAYLRPGFISEAGLRGDEIAVIAAANEGTNAIRSELAAALPPKQALTGFCLWINEATENQIAAYMDAGDYASASIVAARFVKGKFGLEDGDFVTKDGAISAQLTQPAYLEFYVLTSSAAKIQNLDPETKKDIVRVWHTPLPEGWRTVIADDLDLARVQAKKEISRRVIDERKERGDRA
ncbi:MAG: hypothetical protein AB7G80_09345 [Dongiaceae bacterium]